MGNCHICASPYLTPFLDLGEQPLAEAYGRNGPWFPLRLVRCQSCTLVQLDGPVPDQRDLFPEDHPYATGNTRANRKHFSELAWKLNSRLRSGDTIVDIGANDGTLLSMFSDEIRKVAVEPTGQVLKAGEYAHTYRAFFTPGLASQIREGHGEAKLVTATNVLAHVPDPHGFLSGVMILLADDGEFVTENHDLRSLTDGLQVDTVYHEHLRYYDITSLGRLLSMHGLAVTQVDQIAMHGGSFRVTARRTGADRMQARADKAAAALHALVSGLVLEGSRVYGISAATRATPLMHFAKLVSYLDCVCEAEGSEKIGKMMPGTSIPVVPDGKLIADQPEYALLFSHHVADTIVPRLRALGYKGKFIVPLPQPKILNA